MSDQPERARIAVDQLGHPWLVTTRNGDLWALGYDANNVPACRQIFDGTIIVDWSQPNAQRKLIPCLTSPP